MAIDLHMHINNDVCSNVRERIEEFNNDSSISKVINVGLNVPTSRDSYYISFAGRITFKNAKKSIEVLESVPDDLFIVETDIPFIVPEPLKSNGIENSSSSNLHYIIEKIAEIKGTSPKHIENITDRNVKRLFKRMN